MADAVRNAIGADTSFDDVGIGVGAALFPVGIPRVVVGGHRIRRYRELLAEQPEKATVASKESVSLQLTPVFNRNELGLNLLGRF